MKKFSKFLSLFMAVTMMCSLAISAGAAEVKSGDIVVLYTNDVHCGVDDNIGYAGLAAYKAEMLETTDYVTLADAGDAIQGAALGTLSRGEYPVEIMNEVGYDVLVPGNHEFDYGMSRFLELAKLQKSGYVCANFMDLRTNQPVFDAYKMITYGETKVAYVGIDTPEAITKSTPTYFQDAQGNYIYGFCNGGNGSELYNAVQKAVDAAKAEGADYVIAVGHCGIDEQSAPWRSTDIIANVSGLTAFIDGHSHSTIAGENVKDKDGRDVVLTSTGTKLAAIGKLVLKADGTVSTELVTEYTQKDAAVDAFVKDILAQNDALLKKVVARTSVDLTTMEADGTTRAIRNQETNLGDLVADAYRTMSGADVAIVNGGGIRADIKAGNITYEQIIAVHPYGNELRMVNATGQEIVDALEMASRTTPDENGGFLQVSGLSYTIDASVESTVRTDNNKMFVSVDGARRVKDVQVNGQPINLTATYKLASHNYMLESGGDGLNMFMDNTFLTVPAMLDNEVLINYITGTLNGTVPADYAKAQGRITVTGLPTFSDVAVTSPFFAAVNWAVAEDITAGYANGTFAPSTNCTTGHILTFLWRANGSPEPTIANPYTGLDESRYYAKAAIWAYEKGLVEGETFPGDAPCTRSQAVTYLWKLAEKPEAAAAAFSDVAADSDYAQAVAWAVAEGITTGYSDGTFGPDKVCTRGHIVTFLFRNFAEAA